MKRFINIFFTLLITLSFFAVSVSAADFPRPTSFYANDFASVINTADEETINEKSRNLDNACKAQVVVVTVQSLDGMDINDYSIGLAREWGIGDKDKDNGVLLILAVSERKVRIEVGSGLEGALPDSKTGRILDTYGMEYFSSNDFSAGLTAVHNSLVNEIYIEYGITPDEDYEPVTEDLTTTDIIVFVVILIIILFLFFKSPPFLRRRIFFGGGGFGGFSGGNSGGGFSGGGGGFSGGGSSRSF